MRRGLLSAVKRGFKLAEDMIREDAYDVFQVRRLRDEIIDRLMVLDILFMHIEELSRARTPSEASKPIHDLITTWELRAEYAQKRFRPKGDSAPLASRRKPVRSDEE